MEINVVVAQPSHVVYADEICEEILISARERGTGIARRTPEYISEKILAGKAIIAIAEDGRFAGFSYIETWGGKEYVANSGLIVAHGFRGIGLAMRIKTRIFQLSRELFPDAKIFGLTTGEQVMRINTELGYVPVTFAKLTDDEEFWAGCKSCVNFDILERTNMTKCLCTGMVYDPVEAAKRAEAEKAAMKKPGFWARVFGKY